MEPQTATGINLLQENFEDFFEESLCGFVITDPKGIVIRANKKIAMWVGVAPGELTGKRFSDLFTIGGKIYYETHLWPLLRMQGFFDEVVLELGTGTGQKLRVLINALERRDKDGEPRFIRYAILKATDRLQYEQNLHLAKTTAEQELATQRQMVMLREQLIAVLGHDLRNPLSSIIMASEILQASLTGIEDTDLIAMIKRSSSRMTELINNITDFARTRLGEGMILTRQNILLTPVLQQVIAELKIIYPKREIITLFDITEPVNCDPHRIAQLTSNLVANAINHGAGDTPIYLRAFHQNGVLEISVTNTGKPIPENLREQLFEPFKREEIRPSQHGLGLGLYICSEIARAHNGSLNFVSTEKGTCFTFRMNA